MIFLLINTEMLHTILPLKKYFDTHLVFYFLAGGNFWIRVVVQDERTTRYVWNFINCPNAYCDYLHIFLFIKVLTFIWFIKIIQIYIEIKDKLYCHLPLNFCFPHRSWNCPHHFYIVPGKEHRLIFLQYLPSERLSPA